MSGPRCADRRRFAAAAAWGAFAASLGGCAAAGRPSAPEGTGPGAQRLRIAVGSCADQRQPQPIWQTVRAAQPDFVIFGGDNVYASEPPFSAERLRAAYEALQAKPEFSALRDIVPHLAVWDDHDYGLNDGGAGWVHAQVAKDEFLRFWRVAADDPRRHREGLYHAQVLRVGTRLVQVIGLDTRWFRSPLKPTDRRGAPGRERYLPDPDPAKTLLGEAQWHWLRQRLALKADAHVIVSGIQCVVEGHGWERWGNLPLERARLYSLLKQSGASGVLMVSGDRHIGAVYRQQGPELAHPLWELTSSGITHPWSAAAEPGPNRLGPLVTVRHFGVLDFDFEADTLELSLRGEDGRVIQAHAVPLSSLRTTTPSPPS